VTNHEKAQGREEGCQEEGGEEGEAQVREHRGTHTKGGDAIMAKKKAAKKKKK
jgi:hypothetical protein